MRILKILIVSLIIFMLACETTDLDKGKIIGRVRNEATGDLMEGAKVYLRQQHNGNFTLYDTLYSSSIGYFKFYDVESGIYDIHAVKYIDVAESNATHVTAITEQFEFDDQVVSPSVGDIEAYTIQGNASISGTVYYDDGTPAEEASVEVNWVQAEGGQIFNIVQTNADGNFSCVDMITGNYYLVIDSYGTVNPQSYTTDIFFHDGSGNKDLEDIFLN
ncbi:MAG: carboxypeptidase-like regulatory domain-containing protein [Candidatus Cloacimonadota bacterium]|nr:carboxypeptidase-like regulatory domain-containing protein [Candidatus Cloacimonadota bacterium]